MTLIIINNKSGNKILCYLTELRKNEKPQIFRFVSKCDYFEIWILDLCFDSYYPLINQEASDYDA